MPIVNEKPFQAQRLEEERAKDKSRVIPVRVNKEEATWLEEIKEDLNIKSDGKALKTAAFIGRNVLQAQLGRPLLKYLFKNDRQKLEDFKNF